MNEENFNVIYMIDGERNSLVDGGREYLLLDNEYHDDYDLYKLEWDTWLTGKRQDSVLEWNNAWGHTYACYIPLFIGGQKLGLIGTEISFDSVNTLILHAVLNQIYISLIVLIVGMAGLAVFVNHHYISKLSKLEVNVRKYSMTKDFKIAAKIEDEIKGNNEIASLARRISEMILELENYMRNLFSVGSESRGSELHAEKDNDVLRRDALTGIRAGAAFEKELSKLNDGIAAHQTKFGIAVIDLNDLGKINSSYGLDQGNLAIKKLCGICCGVFKHSPVFRIGGDDFVAILKNEDFDNIERLVAEFNEQQIQTGEGVEPWDDISAAVGYAIYSAESDDSAESVLNRAEKAMQARKKQMKSVRRVNGGFS